ncbi:pyruvate ferredoxin oxidoreductase delta subunit [Halalkaliarchaeum desulfuricum]|uniref:Ferredoxin n=1 Tax=Halalkaliarchaeum desulfuricum TaxID=2055893 RepID=A0A343TFA4_9EURY|nr:4Fe-4S binding protein [Halalkaliarchaeum desulfuricum]AUX07776.1 pyruvate ferredoxin oxidoreductase delta subunit [Halalkaliarchaeum desulfuricum]
MSADEQLTLGGVVEPRTSLANETGSWRSQRPVFDAETCIGCGLCERFCPDGVAQEVEGGAYDVDLTYCKGCGICAGQCPVDAIEMVPEVK